MKALFLTFLNISLCAHGYGQHLYSDTYHSASNNFYVKIYKLNDSLNEMYFFCPQNDRQAFMDLVFLKNNRCISFNEHRLQDTTISEFFDINDSTMDFIQHFHNNSFKIRNLLFQKSSTNRYDLIGTMPKYKFFPKINHDNYYYALKKGIKAKTLRLYEEPTLLSPFHEFDFKDNFTQDFTVSTKDFYFEPSSLFSLIGFGEQTADDRFTKLYYIPNEDLNKFFVKSR